MTAIEIQCLEVGELAAYCQDLIDNQGATDIRVTPIVKSWYLILWS